MKRSKLIESSAFIYAGAALLTLAAAAGLKWGFDSESLIRSFFFRCWYIQFANTWLFFVGIFYWIARYATFRSEEKVFKNIELPNYSIRQKDVQELIKTMPQEHKYSLALRRVRALLRALLYGEDLLRLNEELSRSDLANVERGHLILNSIRNIVPVVGFLGTVLGLSLGMIDFPEATNVTALRSALKGFAASLSLAFDTTLLALGYTVVITLLIAYLRGREETLVGQVDESARILLDKIKYEESGIGIPKGDIDPVPGTSSALAREIGKIINSNIKQLVSKLDEIKQDLQRPPRYQVIVQPCERENDEQE